MFVIREGLYAHPVQTQMENRFRNFLRRWTDELQKSDTGNVAE